MHMYECDDSCYDYNNGHICKHIHRVQSLQSGGTTVEPSEAVRNQSGDEDIDPLEYAGSILAPKNGN